jgi:hypothetical protein
MPRQFFRAACGEARSQAAALRRRRDGLNGPRRGLLHRVGLAVGAAAPDLREQRVADHRCIRLQADAGNRTAIGSVRAELALRKQRDLGAVPPLARGDVQQLEEGALAHEDLPRLRIRLGQQPLQVAEQQDLARAAQVDQPGLQVVRMRGEQRVRQHPATYVALVRSRAVPRLQRVNGQGRRTAGGRGEHHAATGQAKEVASVHEGLLGMEWRHCGKRASVPQLDIDP